MQRTFNQHPHLDLKNRAHLEMVEASFSPDFEPAVVSQVQELTKDQQKITSDSSVKDLRSILWSSIDNDDSLDLDQIEYAERLPDGNVHVMVGLPMSIRMCPRGQQLINMRRRTPPLSILASLHFRCCRKNSLPI